MVKHQKRLGEAPVAEGMPYVSISEQAKVREQGMEADFSSKRTILPHLLQNGTRCHQRVASSEQAEIMTASDRDSRRI